MERVDDWSAMGRNNKLSEDQNHTLKNSEISLSGFENKNTDALLVLYILILSELY